LRHIIFAVPDVLAASASMEAIEAFTRRPPEPAITVVSRCWDDTLNFLSRIQDPPVGARRRDPATLAAYYRELAGEIRDVAADMDGPRPSAVYTFIRQHGDPAS
jgi:hypothetical protein